MPTLLNEIGPYSDAKGNLITGTPQRQADSSVLFRGMNCQLTIAPGAIFKGVHFVFESDDSQVQIGENCQFIGMMSLGLQSFIKIGKGLTVTRYCFISASEKVGVTIGDDCMFASANELRCDDAHPIFDMQTGERVNPSKPITIGNHVWLAAKAIVLGGVDIGSGSIVGHSSLVTKSIPENCIAAGIPAKVVREGVVWDRAHVSKTHPHFFPSFSDILLRS